MAIWTTLWLVSFVSVAIIISGKADNSYLELFAIPAVITMYLALILAVLLPLCLAPIQMARGIENRQISQFLLGAAIFAVIEYSLLAWTLSMLGWLMDLIWIVIVLTIFYPKELTKILAGIARRALM